MRPEFTPEFIERFWSKADRSNDPGTCWLWRVPNGNGRGYISIDDKKVQAHRIAWELATGETLTRADIICHTCDVGACVRNDNAGVYVVKGIEYPRVGHLFKATQAVNAADMGQKGRAWRGGEGPPLHLRGRAGEAHYAAVLTENDVREIRKRYRSGGISQRALGAYYGVTDACIFNILSGKNWRHVK